jgi:uncharacterized protein
MTDSEHSHGDGPDGLAEQHRWYELFSRGARDWLRHNDKLRESVRERLPELITGPDIITRPGDRRVQVPVRFMEHYRFRLRSRQEGEGGEGVGQGDVKAGDVLGRRKEEGQGEAGSEGGGGGGGLEYVFELNVDDIVEWIWEELQLPDLKPKTAGKQLDEDMVREGWDRRGPRARLDRRRTLREAIKRRAAEGADARSFTDDDLRYRQIARRYRPSTRAVILFLLDVSASMTEARRKLAKSFFFWALHGLRRQYGEVETVFIAHTNEAWEFTEEEFFQITATGGTVGSSAFRLAQGILADRYDESQFNTYVFYASDGDNFGDDRQRAMDALTALAERANFMGFVETPQNFLESGRSETGRLFSALRARDYPVDTYTVHEHEQIWEAIRAFFVHEARQEAR